MFESKQAFERTQSPVLKHGESKTVSWLLLIPKLLKQGVISIIWFEGTVSWTDVTGARAKKPWCFQGELYDTTVIAVGQVLDLESCIGAPHQLRVLVEFHRHRNRTVLSAQDRSNDMPVQFVGAPLHIWVNHYGSQGHSDSHVNRLVMSAGHDEEIRHGPVRILMRDGQRLHEPEVIQPKVGAGLHVVVGPKRS